MSERRRSSFILLLVALLVGGSIYVVATKPTVLGLDLQGGSQLVYKAEGTPQSPLTPEAMQRTLDLMQQRVNEFGVSEAELMQTGNDQIEVNLPGVTDAEAAAEQVGSTAQLYFYDWEANLLNEDCKTDPDQNSNQRQAISGLRTAVEQASKCTDVGIGTGLNPLDDDSPGGPSVAAREPAFYVFNRDTKEPIGPSGSNFPSREDALDSVPENLRSKAEVIEVPAGVLVLREQKAEPDDPDPDRWWVIQDRPGLSGTDIKDPEQSFDTTLGNEPIVTFNFTDKGRAAFQAITRHVAERGADNALGGDPLQTSQHFAIALDNELVSAPYINWRENSEGIDGSTGAQISGSFTIESAQDLATILKIGALPLELTEVSRSQVSATLGQQALDQGLLAGIAGFIIVALFLIVFYRVLGIVATLAMVIYALYTFAVVKLIPITLTLPGIAGMILTLGVAADANIVIFERVKEEVRAGRSVGTAIVTGYRKGLTAIVDANIVTFLVAFILFILATSGVQGFAFTLGLGVILSLLTAVLATQAILYSLRNTRLLSGKWALGAGEKKHDFKIDYMGKAKWFFSASGIILLACALAMSANGINFGIDFEGGSRITAPLREAATVDQVRETVAPLGLADAKIQTLDNEALGPNVVQISTEEGVDVDAVNNALDDEFGNPEPNVEEIGPSFGESVANSALIAIIASLLVITVYLALRFEPKFTVPVLIAVMHDILIVAGVYALLGLEVTTSTVAALLTVLGYSLYDTIIVMDRIRENVPRMPSAAFSQIVNRSLSEVIVRSLATSFCTLLPVLALMLFGGETLRDFAFALFIGIASGTYSSIFIATPVLQHWKEREPAFRARHARILERLGTVPAYAVADQGGPIDVQPKERKRRSVSAPPGQEVSATEFQEMVQDLGIQEESTTRQPAATAAAAAAGGRPVGGRRARARANGGVTPPSGGDGSTPPANGGNGDNEAAKERKPRNRRHGRPR
ncbi:protein translocase subunit SecD [Solirubrobacter sp. CPCC 204708]|uniref:Multifunctional fusion protein n=1 Tax=Solirubrobacter deserti TaxID=2282478 RepID=A0ABT4RH76_9ACTN|nr:protein translocase subunit SecD [Solirubrobacter deserti]MBE2315422.1 protein translocase subunit SecD [Solirubrobacter deserti]MDA0137736.1 protein translocase subunit SecD [Solirubrobacter deserti]